MKKLCKLLFLASVGASLAGCAFDVDVLSTKPVTYTAESREASFVLLKEAKAHIGTGFPTILRANTLWKQTGSTEYGAVYSTKDQVVKVEASNISEAWIVVSSNSLAGFYLPIENRFVPVHASLPLETQTCH